MAANAGTGDMKVSSVKIESHDTSDKLAFIAHHCPQKLLQIPKLLIC